MLGSILSAGGGARASGRLRILLLVFLHATASAASAALIGALLTLLAALLRPFPVAGIVATILFVALTLLFLPRMFSLTDGPELLESGWQVPRRWLRLRPWPLAPVLYGLVLGTGVATRLVTPAFYLLLLVPFLGPPWYASVAAWGLYGLTRTAPLWWLMLPISRAAPLERASSMAGWLIDRQRWMEQGTGLVLSALLIAFLAGGHA